MVKLRSDAVEEIVVASAIDDAYALPLAVAIRSALSCLGHSRRIKLYVLDGGLSDENKTRLLSSWTGRPILVEWCEPDMAQLCDLPTSGHVSVVAYLRLLMATLLPSDVRRAIYLDADAMVRRDLGELWSEDQCQRAVLAVQDLGAPFFNSAAALPRFDSCAGRLSAVTPIANYRELGLRDDGKYFNSGVLVVDLEQWRQEDYATRMLRCLHENREHVTWWDQYALNVVLAENWRALDPRWNQTPQVYRFADWRESPLDSDTYHQLRTDPWIIHFSSAAKPWNYFCRHPATDAFRQCLKETAWADWQPQPPAQFLRRWWGHHYKPLRNQVAARLRTVKHALRTPRDRAA